LRTARRTSPGQGGGRAFARRDPGLAVPPASSPHEWRWALGGLVALAALAFACRGGLAGVPVADDYAFLERTSGLAPWSWFDSMGAAYYWRPVSRQLWFALVAPLLESQPALVALIHVALLGVVYAGLWRIARCVFAAPAATAIAAFPLASEPARLLVAWPSAAQHLLAMAFAAWAVERAIAGRVAVAAALALLAVLSLEAAWPLLALVPWLVWRRHGRDAGRRAAIAAFAVTAVWAGGYAVARQHGVVLPIDEVARPWSALGVVTARTVAAQLNLEELAPAVRTAAVAAYALVLLAAAAWVTRRRARRRLIAHRVVLLGFAWAMATLIPQVLVWPDWNAWRTSLPSLGLAVVGIGALAALSPRLALAASAVRLATLLAATPAAAVVTRDPPAAVSDLSYPRLARLQRVVHSTRTVVLDDDRPLRRGAKVRYWLIPSMAEVGFRDMSAPRVWRRDPTLDWNAYGGVESFQRREPVDLLIEYSAGRPWPAVAIQPRALGLWRDAMDAVQDGRLATADTLLTAAIAAQPQVSEPFYASVSRTHARVALADGDPERARALNAVDRRHAGESVSTLMMDAWIALASADTAAARHAVERAWMRAPNDGEVRDLAARIAPATLPAVASP
jgi:hypothetical protein